jgi:hypothetical protein
MDKNLQKLRGDVRFLEWSNNSREISDDDLYDMDKYDLSDYKDDLLMGRK